MKSKFVIGSVLLALVAYCWLRCGHQFDPKSIENQRILVTGASSGIGEQLAYQYSKLGARLVITARRESLLKEVVKRCQEMGAKHIEAFPADMTKPEDREQLMKFTQKTLGGLDQLILNHAALRYKLWHVDSEQNMDILQRDLAVNFISFVDLTSRALPMLQEAKGHIGVVSSVLGKVGMFGSCHYASTKFALDGFFSSLRQELNIQKSDVSVTLLVLGFIKTDAAVKIVTDNYGLENTPVSPASPTDAALYIIEQVSNRVSEAYYPFSSSIIVTVTQLFPDFVNYMYVKMAPMFN